MSIFSKKRLRWGLLSTAHINRSVIPAIEAASRSKLWAVASRSAEKAETYARDWNIPRWYGSYDELLADPDVDVIYNSLPNHLHAQWTVKAAQAGKHVLCEKPLALSIAEVDAVQAAASAAGVVVAEAFMYRHHPQTLKVQQMAANGDLGDLGLIRGTFTFPLNRPDDYRWLVENGGGSLLDVGCYPISYAILLAGAPPLEVFGWQTHDPGKADATFAGQLRFAGGLLAQFTSSFALNQQDYMELVGTKASLHISDPYTPWMDTELIYQQGREEKVMHLTGQHLYLGEIEDIEAAVWDKKPQRIPLDESRWITASIVALQESARSGQPIQIRP